MNRQIEKVVVVTGASAGVGRAVARRFARTGAKVALIARGEEALEGAKREMESVGGRALAIPLDVADGERVLATAGDIERELGPIDIWVNNAMLTVFSPVSEMTPQEFHRVTEVTYLGFVYGTMAAIRCMKPRNRGVIIQVGSSLAYRGIPLQAAYCGAKHAIRGFTDSLRSELLHDRSRIKLVMVQLPAVNTPQFDWARTHMPHEPRPVPPVIQPEAAADAIFRAAMKPSREVWLGLSTAKTVLGSIAAPTFVDRYLAAYGYPAQQTGKPVAAGRKDNLTEPVAGLHRSRGSFGGEARESAVSLSERDAKGGAMILGIGLAAASGVLLGRFLEQDDSRRPWISSKPVRHWMGRR
jgi:NAD(P)-dependent dehydrogenase (short-subunit alcohol dehydrogenase family)